MSLQLYFKCATQGPAGVKADKLRQLGFFSFDQFESEITNELRRVKLFYALKYFLRLIVNYILHFASIYYIILVCSPQPFVYVDYKWSLPIFTFPLEFRKIFSFRGI